MGSASTMSMNVTASAMSTRRPSSGRRLAEPLGDLGVDLGEMIQSIHLYMQFGCLALDEIIQVSDQPVAPSLGTTVSTLALPSPVDEVGDDLPGGADHGRADSKACTSLV
jgi:hypothetical protein